MSISWRRKRRTGEVRGSVKTLLLRARPDLVASQKRGFGFRQSPATVPSCPKLGRPRPAPGRLEGGERQGGAGPEDAPAGRQGGAWRGAAGRHRTPWCAARVRSSWRPERKRLGARERQPRSGQSATVGPGSGSEAPAGGEAGRRGRRCSARSGGLGELCPPVPQARAGTGQLGRRASSPAELGDAQPGVPGADSGPKSSRAPGRGGPRRSQSCGPRRPRPPPLRPAPGGCPGPLGPPR